MKHAKKIRLRVNLQAEQAYWHRCGFRILGYWYKQTCTLAQMNRRYGKSALIALYRHLRPGAPYGVVVQLKIQHSRL